jgi:hypothetical protein
VLDRHVLRIGAAPPEGRVIAGLYDSRTLARLPAGGGDAVTLAEQ